MSGDQFHVRADTYVVAAGLLTTQLLWNSGLRPEALGRYLTEHPIAFGQIVLSETLIETIAGSRLQPRVAHYGGTERRLTTEAEDPVPIPMWDPPPMVWIPVSESRPWHCQVHRDSFHYGAVPPNVDDRLIVDLRWFGMVDANRENRVLYDEDLNDKFGMPKPRFEFTLSSDDRRRAHEMMGDLLEAAQVLGGFLTGAEPRFMPPGSSLHFMGTYRMGEEDGESVVDSHSRVWGIENLYLGGNGVIATSTAANPTLTSVALALRSVESILGEPVEPVSATTPGT